MNPFSTSTQSRTSSKPDPRAQFPTPLPEELHAGAGLRGEAMTPMQNSLCQVSGLPSTPYTQSFPFLSDPAAMARGGYFYDPGRMHPFPQSLAAYPSPSAGSDAFSEDASTPSDTAFMSPALDIGSFPPHHPFALLPHGDFGTCVDPTVISPARPPQSDGLDAGLARARGSSRPRYDDVGALVAPSQRLLMTEGAQYMQDVVDSSSCVASTLDPAQRVAYDAYLGQGIAAPQPPEPGPSPAAYLPSPSRGLVVIPRVPSQCSTQPDAGLCRDPHAGGEKGGEVYPCLFQGAGCLQEFLGKNEWKRHVNTIHVRWDVWVCTQGECASVAISWAPTMVLGEPSFPRAGRVFNRKDLYIMHLGRRHHRLLPPKPSADKKHLYVEQEKVAAQACCRRIQLPRDMKGIECPLQGCDEAFGGSSGWDGFLEHVANQPKRAHQSRRAAADEGSWLGDSLTSFGVSAGFLREDGAGRWKLCDPIWNEGPRGKRGHRRRSGCHRGGRPVQRTAGIACPGPPRRRVQTG